MWSTIHLIQKNLSSLSLQVSVNYSGKYSTGGVVSFLYGCFSQNYLLIRPFESYSLYQSFSKNQKCGRHRRRTVFSQTRTFSFSVHTITRGVQMIQLPGKVHTKGILPLCTITGKIRVRCPHKRLACSCILGDDNFTETQVKLDM